MGIQEVSRSWAHPTPPVDPKVEVPLSDLDVIQVPFHVPVLIVYRSRGAHQRGDGPPTKKTGSPPTASLKVSLECTLGAFYTLAGRIRNSSGRPALYGFNEGVPFVEAQSDSDLPTDAHLQPAQFSPDLLATPPAGVSGMPLGVPVLSVKVTRFRCGGLVLGISFHHQVADASAFFQFLSAWASVARGASPSSPHLNRTVLIDREEGAGAGSKDVRLNTSSSAWGPLLATWQQHTSFWRAYADLCWRSLGRKQSLFRVTFSKEEVAWLKRKANETGEESWDGSQDEASSGDRWASSNDAVCAHMWQRITRARAFSADANVTFDRHVDMRSRLDPPLAPNYIGSGNTGPPRMVLPAGELLGRTLGQVAQRLRRDIVQMDESYLAALFKKLKSAAFIPHFVARAPPFGTAVRVTSWAKFPLYDLDFGWGRPALVTLSMLPPFFDGVVELQQTPEEDGGLDAIVFLQEEHLQRLRSDPNLHPRVAD